MTVSWWLAALILFLFDGDTIAFVLVAAFLLLGVGEVTVT